MYSGRLEQDAETSPKEDFVSLALASVTEPPSVSRDLQGMCRDWTKIQASYQA